MTKLSRKPINDKKLGLYVNNLWAAFTLMADKEQIRDLFRDLFTHTEYKMLAKRLQIARFLLDGETYESIMNELNVSEKTVAHISNILSIKGVGFRNAHSKLNDLDRQYKNKRAVIQSRLERKGRPRMPGEDALPDLIMGTLSAIEKGASKRFKQSSARTELSL